MPTSIGLHVNSETLLVTMNRKLHKQENICRICWLRGNKSRIVLQSVTPGKGGIYLTYYIMTYTNDDILNPKQ